MRGFAFCLFSLFVLALAAGVAQADVFDMPDGVTSLEWVTVGNPGNAGDDEVMMQDSTTGYGAVADAYRMGKYEVTNGQYIEFLEAVATTGDPNGLYCVEDDHGYGGMDGSWGGIERTGTGPYWYGAKGGDTNWLNRPVNYVSWYNTLRFANWLHNGQPTGEQDATTTEDGAYDMSLGSSVVRKLGATVFLPSEDEWYKAAYYKGGSTNAGYWDYPTSSDTRPTVELPPGTDMVNGSGNFYPGGVLDTTYHTTEVGAYDVKPSDSPYGTFDQGGNLWEWNEALIATARGFRGGAFDANASYLHASSRLSTTPTIEYNRVGFRVSEVPEPATLSLVGLGALGMIVRRKRK